MRLCRRIDLDRVAIELDRSIHLSPYLIAVGLSPEFRRSSQGRSFFHCFSSLVARRIRPSFSSASEEKGDVVTPPRGARRGRTSGRFCSPNAAADSCREFSSPSLELSGSLSKEYMASGRPSRL